MTRLEIVCALEAKTLELESIGNRSPNVPTMKHTLQVKEKEGGTLQLNGADDLSVTIREVGKWIHSVCDISYLNKRYHV